VSPIGLFRCGMLALVGRLAARQTILRHSRYEPAFQWCLGSLGLPSSSTGARGLFVRSRPSWQALHGLRSGTKWPPVRNAYDVLGWLGLALIVLGTAAQISAIFLS
jgi:hypothetical protein